MAQKFRIKSEGVKQGPFKGGSPRKGWEDCSECFGFDYEVNAPFDANHGQYSGKRRHQPVTIRKEVDKASPLYLTALCNNETMKTIKIDFFRPSKDGKETNYYSIVLTNAAVVGVRTFTAQDSTHSEGRDTFDQEEIKFAFQKIDVTFNDGGISMSDDWQAIV